VEGKTVWIWDVTEGKEIFKRFQSLVAWEDLTLEGRGEEKRRSFEK
jgi:hypothetical protein